MALGVVFVSAALVFDVEGDETLVPVLVAKHSIPEGTRGNRISVEEMYVRTTLRRSQVEDGAIAAPMYLCGRVAASKISPGEQLTADHFHGDERVKIHSDFSGTPHVRAAQQMCVR